jgi:hypothetical protein
MGYDFMNLKKPETFTWEVDKDQTLLMDDAYVREGKFRVLLDMSKKDDYPKMYPLTKDTYKLVIWMNPVDMAEYLQDRLGWKGEGFQDKPYLNTGMYPGFRTIKKEYILKKSDII